MIFLLQPDGQTPSPSAMELDYGAAFAALETFVAHAQTHAAYRDLLGPKIMQRLKGKVAISTAYHEVAQGDLEVAASELEREKASMNLQLAALKVKIDRFEKGQVESVVAAFEREQGALVRAIAAERVKNTDTFQQHLRMYWDILGRLPLQIKDALEVAEKQAAFEQGVFRSLKVLNAYEKEAWKYRAEAESRMVGGHDLEAFLQSSGLLQAAKMD